MTIYCTGKTNATVNIFSPPTKVSAKAPVDIYAVNSSTESYSHNMLSPINKSYEQDVLSVILSPPGQTYNNGAPVNPIRACPIPDISGKSIISNFDDYYPDNRGTCNYQVTLVGGVSINGKTFPSNDGQFSVVCDDECPPGFCKCIIPEYPGYCCLNCSETAASIRSITNELKGKNG